MLINLTIDQQQIVQDILRAHVPTCTVWAFGSRVVGTAQAMSDLDLVLIHAVPLPPGTLCQLTEAFEASNLPFRVDVIDWDHLADDFRAIIRAQYVLLT